jgi:hypothetical protein
LIRVSVRSSAQPLGTAPNDLAEYLEGAGHARVTTTGPDIAKSAQVRVDAKAIADNSVIDFPHANETRELWAVLDQDAPIIRCSAEMRRWPAAKCHKRPGPGRIFCAVSVSTA